MSKRTVYDVVPDGDNWKVAERGGRSYGSHLRKDQAVKAARNLADESKPSQIVIHDEEGCIEEERTYGNDACSPEG